MKYEIINPSDECYLEHPEQKVAITAGLVLGGGAYGLKSVETCEMALPILAFGGAEEFLNKTFGGPESYALFVAENYRAISDALLSVSLPQERTSLNDIAGRAHSLGRTLAKKAQSREDTAK